jgi:hypothetical protein
MLQLKVIKLSLKYNYKKEIIMKKLFTAALVLTSLSSFAGISCSGGGVSIEINESAKTLNISGDYNGEIKHLKGEGEEFRGSASSGDFKSLSINIDDGEVDITDKNGRAVDTIDVNCD